MATIMKRQNQSLQYLEQVILFSWTKTIPGTRMYEFESKMALKLNLPDLRQKKTLLQTLGIIYKFCILGASTFVQIAHN